MKTVTLACTAAASLLASAAATGADGFSLGVGANYSTGDYGTDVTTEIVSIPVTARFDTGNWSFRASLPWISITGDPNVLPGTGPVSNVNPIGRGRLLPPVGEDGDFGETRGSASGIGDLTLRAVYSLPTQGPMGADISFIGKIATADEDKGLGTGANDYGVAVDLYRSFGDTTLFGGVSYMSLGSSTFIDVDNVFGANVGVSWTAGTGQLGVMYDYREAASSRFDDRSEVTVFYSAPTAGGNRFQIYGLAGLSDGSPDFGAGVNYTWSF
jgi:hypothetical protein